MLSTHSRVCRSPSENGAARANVSVPQCLLSVPKGFAGDGPRGCVAICRLPAAGVARPGRRRPVFQFYPSACNNLPDRPLSDVEG